ncbi:hypothetical protein ACI2IY_07590 [Lysobacter enzymogenes]|uniref:hypothetical protein n=1 Tax=Lysobacter enzymogenes TaxID=69 RepID=UPI00384FC43C
MLIVLTVVCAFLGHRVLRLESEVHQLQRNAAIAVFSAAAANRKIGAFAPYFAEDKEDLASAWIDGSNMHDAIFLEDALIPIQSELPASRRNWP